MALPPEDEADSGAAILARRENLAAVAAWADRLVARQQPLVTVGFGSALIRRRTVGEERRLWAQGLARRFAKAEQRDSSSDLVISPYAPPQRQISVSRQGAADWSGGEGGSDLPAILKDLQDHGWR